MIQVNLNLLANSIRLLFSDCIGPIEDNNDPSIVYDETPTYVYNTICDGCINLRDSFHDGLYDLVIEPLDVIFLDGVNSGVKMTLADFWAAVATVAVEYAVELSGYDGTFGYRYILEE